MTREHDADERDADEREAIAEEEVEEGDASHLDEPEPYDEPVAPVVTDEGVFGRLPDRQRALREYEREERPLRGTWVRLAGAVLIVAGGLWLVLFSAAQATSDQVARPALESLVSTMTGLPGLLELHQEAIREAEGDAAIPGYPLAGVTVPARLLADGPDAWLASVLGQSSAILYEEGPDAFAPEAEAGGAGTFSTPGGTRLLMENLTASRHSQASALLWPLGGVALAAAAFMVLLGGSFGRFGAPAMAVVVASVPALGAGVLGWALVQFIGSDGSALAESSHRIASDLVAIPLRNGITVAVAGLAVALVARLLGAVLRPADRGPAASDDAAYDTRYE